MHALHMDQIVTETFKEALDEGAISFDMERNSFIDDLSEVTNAIEHAMTDMGIGG